MICPVAYAQTAMLAAQANIMVVKNRVSRSSVLGAGISNLISFIGHGVCVLGLQLWLQGIPDHHWSVGCPSPFLKSLRLYLDGLPTTY